MAAFRERANADPELRIAGEKFDASFSLTFEATRYVLRVAKGRIEEILLSPRFDTRTSFGVRAPMSVWSKFLDPDPPPLFHDCFAMLMRVPDFVLDGDTLAAMQNARALHRMLNLLREAAPATGEAAGA